MQSSALPPTDHAAVRAQQLVHLEHRRLVLAEHGLELVVGKDRALVGRILQAVGPDAIPDLLDDLGAGQGALPTVAANSVDSVRQVRRVAAKLSAR